MSRTEFLSISVAIHAILLVLAFLMPKPFPAPRLPEYTEELIYVQPASAGKPGIKSGSAGSGASGKGNYIAQVSPPRNGRIVSTGAHNGAKRPATAADNKKILPFAGQAKPAPASSRRTNLPEKISKIHASVTSQKASLNPPVPQEINQAAHAPAAPASLPEIKVIPEERAEAVGVKVDRQTVNFKYQQGWPAPGMAGVMVNVLGGKSGAKVGWRAKSDEKWLILSPSSGSAPGVLKLGIIPYKSVGFYDSTVSIKPLSPGVKGDHVEVTLMVFPKEKGKPYLPHSNYDKYMNGNCKVCHMPKDLLPEPDFLQKPAFCSLCHNPSGMANAFVTPVGGGHTGMKAGAGGTKIPSLGANPEGPFSDMMSAHLPGGRIECITCHNVMEKPGDYGRTWEPASSGDGVNWWLYKGGWSGMGYMEPKVYVVENISEMPKTVHEMRRWQVPASKYSYDAADGVIIFNQPVSKRYSVYVTLTEPYLRVSTQNNALCYDCHSENTHQGLNCLTCHRIHGARNAGDVRGRLRTPFGVKKVSFDGRVFAKNGSGICDACHPLSGRHLKYKGESCTKCHTHKGGFD